ncbi:MAG: hypothetical protein ABFS43_06170 [Thermodesulfobacteriota bacterium]
MNFMVSLSAFIFSGGLIHAIVAKRYIFIQNITCQGLPLKLSAGKKIHPRELCKKVPPIKRDACPFKI